MSSDPQPDASLRPGASTSAMSPSPSDGAAMSGLKDEGRQLASKAADTVRAAADKRKDGVTNQVNAVSSAIGSAADEIERHDDLPSWLVSGARKVAGSVEQFAGTLEGKSSTELFADLKKFAGDRPVIFLTACAAAGFVASRVLGAENAAGDAR